MPVFNKYASSTTPFVQRIDSEPHTIHLTNISWLFKQKVLGCFVSLSFTDPRLFRRSFFFFPRRLLLFQFIYYNSFLSQRLYFLRISSLRRCLSSFFFSFSSCLFLAASSLSIFLKQDRNQYGQCQSYDQINATKALFLFINALATHSNSLFVLEFQLWPTEVRQRINFLKIFYSPNR